MKKVIMMKSVFAILALAVVMTAGCAAPSKVKMKRESVDWRQEKEMIQRSLENFDEGIFYAYDWSEARTAAIVVDLKDPERTIKPGPGWRKINSRQELELAYKRGSITKGQVNMRLYRIEGDDGEIWGYFFAPNNVLPYAVIDDRTIQLGLIPEPQSPGGK